MLRSYGPKLLTGPGLATRAEPRGLGCLLLLAPVATGSGEDSIAADCLGGGLQGVGGGAPDRVVWRCPMRLDRGFVLVDLVEVEGVGGRGVFQDVEAQAAGLVALGAECVDLYCLEELLPHVRLDANFYP